MTGFDVVVFLLLGGIALVATAPVWGPVVLAVAAVAVMRRLWPTGRHRAPGTPVRTAVRTSADTGPEPGADNALTCADTYPDVSADTGPDLSGHDDAGER